VNSLWTTLNWILYFNEVLHLYLQWMNWWQSGLVIMAVVTSRKLHYALRRSQLVLRVWDAWPFSGIQPTTSVCNQPLRLTHPRTLSGKGNKYWSRDSGSALRWDGDHRSGFAPAECHRIWHISTYRLNGLRKGDEHPTYTPVRCIAPYFLNFILSEAVHWK